MVGYVLNLCRHDGSFVSVIVHIILGVVSGCEGFLNIHTVAQVLKVILCKAATFVIYALLDSTIVEYTTIHEVLQDLRWTQSIPSFRRSSFVSKTDPWAQADINFPVALG